MALSKGFEPPPPLPEKNLLCKIGLHQFENAELGKMNLCKICKRKYYVKTLKEKIENVIGDGDGILDFFGN